MPNRSGQIWPGSHSALPRRRASAPTELREGILKMGIEHFAPRQIGYRVHRLLGADFRKLPDMVNVNEPLGE
jgi:hypothetical protein